MHDVTVKMSIALVFDFRQGLECWCIDAYKIYKAFKCREAKGENYLCVTYKMFNHTEQGISDRKSNSMFHAFIDSSPLSGVVLFI